jgi:hypothetical protein
MSSFPSIKNWKDSPTVYVLRTFAENQLHSDVW